MTFMTIRKGSSLIFVESATGDVSGVAGDPTAWIVPAQDGADEPEVGATQIPLTVVDETGKWRMTLSNTTSLAIGRYLIYSRYQFVNGNVYIPEPTLLIVKA
jgi:hypothetical protein